METLPGFWTSHEFPKKKEKLLPQKYDEAALVRVSRARHGAGGGAHSRRRGAECDAHRRRHGPASQHEAAPDGPHDTGVVEKDRFPEDQRAVHRFRHHANGGGPDKRPAPRLAASGAP